MSERPDLFVNKKSSLAEIIEVRNGGFVRRILKKGSNLVARGVHRAHRQRQDFDWSDYYDGLTSRRTALASYFTESVDSVVRAFQHMKGNRLPGIIWFLIALAFLPLPS
jgi:hypothetical protein